MRPRRGQLVSLALWGLVGVLAIRLALFSLDAAARPSDGFVAYYTAARLVAGGADPARFYDEDWFAARVHEQTPRVYDIYSPNPPTTALMMLPISALDYRSARVLWTLLSLTCLVGSLAWILRGAGLDGPYGAGLVGFALLYQPVYANLNQGQAYLLLLCLLVAAWQGYRCKSDGLLGVALGLMLALKTAGVLLWILLLVQRRWRALTWGAATGLALALGSLLWLGLDAWRTYLLLLPGLASQPDFVVTAYQSQLGLFRHLLTFDSRWNPTPWLEAPILAGWLTWTSFAAVLVASVSLARGKQPSDRAFAAFVVASLVMSPLSLDYHYTLLLLPIALLLAEVQKQPTVWGGSALVVGAALVASDLPFRSPRLAVGAWALLAYPKLYGAWLLWAGNVSTKTLSARFRKSVA